MADKDLGDGPSLELPKLFGRKDKKRRGDDPAADEASTAPEATAAPEDRPVAPSPEPEPAPEPETVEAEGVEPETPDPRAVDPAEVTMPLPVPAPAAPEPTTEPTTEPAVPEPEPVATPEPEPVAPTAPTAPTERAPEPAPIPAATRVGTRPEPEPESQAESSGEATGRRRAPTAPDIPPGVATVLVGALVAALGIGLTWLGLLGCEAVRGTQSCGGPGLLIMLTIMVALVIGGAALLKALGVPQSGSLSFLGFGILTVVVLTFLAESLYEPWVLVMLPVISAAGYGIAYYVTTRFAEPELDPDLRR